ncbi:MAG: DUF4290 domain-containing protein [Bacteroidales bacterium]|nr:DUF4290 domain-containing protein [Bacteroidales bacterium]
MSYNTSREKIALPEFGRNFQNMVEYINTIEDKTLRTKAAYRLVEVMSNMTTAAKEGDFNRKLWDQMFIMSDYKLDVDSPYPMPEREEVNKKPMTVNYSVNNIHFRHYGKLIHSLINKASEMEDGEDKDKVVSDIALQMKKLYLQWSLDNVEDLQIFQDLQILSGGKVKVNPDLVLPSSEEIMEKERDRNSRNQFNNRKGKKQNKKKKNRDYQKQ